tara:strand:+ start:1763 stop:2122 length:360 start_codon:yes stop_codon:yes gene_type:complete
LFIKYADDTLNDDWVNYWGQKILGTGLIENLIGWGYWSNTQLASDPYDPATNNDSAMSFRTGDGYQTLAPKENSFYAWAVRDGDIFGSPQSVSEPKSIILLSLGLLILSVRSRARYKSL